MERALAAARRLPTVPLTEVLDAEAALGDVRELAGQFDRALDAYRQGLGLAGDVGTKASMLVRMARARERAGQYSAAHRDLTCNSCHSAHRYDSRTAAVEACLGCHADGHSLAYEGTAHHTLWESEQSGELPSGSCVSCATCHMPRIDVDVSDWMSRKVVEHNQSATLSPNSKMIRPACLHCHGLGFAIDALADRALIDRNFDAHPSVSVDSIALARAYQERYLREREAARQ